MLNTSVLFIFRTFSSGEIKRFEEFLLSPYFNKKSAVVNLYRIIKNMDPVSVHLTLKEKRSGKDYIKTKNSITAL
ncbi:MAG: hypothetical protein IPL53_15600 [Ignavibacteria bacterium]|nr:hypothetical protein [Ignavibacteria bacterium]